MAYTATGKVHKIFDTQTFSSGFSKREMVIETEDRFPQLIKFDFLKEKGELLEKVKEGQQVTVHFDIGGREYNGRYYVDLKGWKIESGGGEQSGAPADDDAPLPEDTTDYGSVDDEEDVPF